MTVRAIEWDPATDRLRLLDQTKLPGESVHLDIKSVDALVDAIAILAVRGAPALGVAGAMGVVTALDEGAERGWHVLALTCDVREAPEVDGQILVALPDADAVQQGDFVSVKMTGVQGYDMMATLAG